MRPLCVIGLLAGLAALAGCGSSSTTSGGPPPDAHKQNANNFHEKPANKNVSGEKIPSEFFDKDGNKVDLATYRGKQHVVLVVVKGFPDYAGAPGQFCPGCLAQVNSLVANHQKFKDKDAEILMLFPGRTDRLSQFLDDGRANPVPFPMLTDKDLKVVSALGIASDVIKQAVPSTYILDKQGKVAFAYVADTSLPDVTFDRPSAKSLLDQLDKLNAKK
jgi:peroxiredoxin